MKALQIIAVLLAFIAGAALRIGLVDRQSLWSDEFFSLAVATGHSLDHFTPNAVHDDFQETDRPVSPSVYGRYLEHESPVTTLERVWRAAFLSDTNPPLYYVFIWAWTRAFGTTDAALRLFSVLVGLLCLGFIWLLGRRIAGSRAGLFALILSAVSPLFIYYSTEGRMYSMLTLCSVLTIWLTVRLLEKEPNIFGFGLWALVCGAGMLTHYFFVFVWFVSVVWGFMQFDRRSRVYAVAASCFTILLILPWYIKLPQALVQARTINNWLTIRPGFYDPVISPLALPWRLLSPDLGDARWSLSLITVIIFAAFATVVLRKLSWSLFSGPRTLLWAWFLAPCAGIVLFDLVCGTYTVSVTRYALAAAPAVPLLLGTVLSRLGRRSQLLFFSLILVLALAGDRRLYLAEARVGQPYLKVARLLATEVQKSDIVIVHSGPSGVAGVARYLRSFGNGQEEGHINMVSWVEKLGRRRVPEDIKAFAGGRRRVILVRIHDRIYEKFDLLAEQRWLEQNARLTYKKRIGTATICYFEPRYAATFQWPGPHDLQLLG